MVNKRLRTVKIILIIILLALLLSMLGFVIVQWWAGRKIEKTLNDGRFDVGSGSITTEIVNAKVNLFSRNVTLDDLVLHYSGRDSTEIYAKIPRISVSGLNLKILDSSEDLKLGNITIQSPDVVVDLYKTKNKESYNNADSAAGSRTISIDNIAIRNANAIINSHQDDRATKYEIADMNFDLSDIISEPSREILRFSEIFLNVSSIVGTNPDASVITTVGEVNFENSSLTIANVEIQPQYDKYKFASRNYLHSDWTAVVVDGITANGIDIERILNSGQLSIEDVILGNAVIESYKNRNIRQAYRFKKMIFEQLHDIGFPLHIGRVEVGKTKATYWETAEGDSDMGVVYFTNLTGEFRDVSNIDSEDSPFFTLNARGMLYGSGPIEAVFYFPKSSETNHFEVRGHIGTMDLTHLNRMIRPLANAEVERGLLNSLQFHISGTRARSSVDLVMLYDNLNIELLKEKNGHYRDRKFISWIANIAVKDANPSRRGKVRSGQGVTDRDLNKSQFNYLWKSLLPGIKETVI